MEALVEKWYEKLRQEGFEDIEHGKHLKKQHSIYFKLRYTPDVFQMKQEYYRRAGHFLYEYEFESDQQKKIWEHHSEGKSIREIAQYFRDRGVKTSKDIIHKYITDLVAIMHRTYDE